MKIPDKKMLLNNCLDCKYFLSVFDEYGDKIYDRGRCIHILRDKEYIYADETKICDKWQPKYFQVISGDFETFMLGGRILNEFNEKIGSSEIGC